ncbi:RNA polymerase sigma factor [Paraburkholderia sp. ZP32-5]|uniref:RNA polymerase sigma factor n=1 Tax=Paraburkholderia sp. ZP32-5 TaxID=2883245 RepID=UPI001F21CD72|nr:RNA polymerase sigma factor [Paraburkholderia sp. ZP32-5]
MTDSRNRLKKLFVSRYTQLRRQLEYYIGSRDHAADALHETWLRLDSMPDVSVTADDAYLLRMATNIAIDQNRREQRYLSGEEIGEILLQVKDELADPERIVAARLRVDALKIVLDELTPRRRAILLAARVDGELNREIAERMGISLRLVEAELSTALKHCYNKMLDLDPATTKQLGKKGRRKF